MGALVRAAAITAGIGAGCFAWGLAEASMFTLRQVAVPALPAAARRELRILHVSDIHLLPRQARKLDFLRHLARLAPDLVINTGDNIADAAAIDPLLAGFDGLRDVPGVFVFGSNDYHAPMFKNPLRYVTHGRSVAPENPTLLPTGELRSRFEAVGWRDLTHRRVRLEVAGYRVAFRGTDDAHTHLDDYALVAGPAEDADLNVAVTHAPYLRLLDAMASDGMDLIVAGHTHGGQVCMPFHGALTTNCDLDTRRAKGLSLHTAGGHTSFLHVSAGLGTSPMAPYRFACRPEATLLTLTPRAR